MQAAEHAGFPTRHCDALAKGFFENRNVQSSEATLSSFQSVCMLSGMPMRSAFSKRNNARHVDFGVHWVWVSKARSTKTASPGKSSPTVPRQGWKAFL